MLRAWLEAYRERTEVLRSASEAAQKALIRWEALHPTQEEIEALYVPETPREHLGAWLRTQDHLDADDRRNILWTIETLSDEMADREAKVEALGFKATYNIPSECLS